jgi:hypothetical protein
MMRPRRQRLYVSWLQGVLIGCKMSRCLLKACRLSSSGRCSSTIEFGDVCDSRKATNTTGQAISYTQKSGLVGTLDIPGEKSECPDLKACTNRRTVGSGL